MGRFWKSAPTMSLHRCRKGHQVPFIGIGLFSRPKARYGLVDEDPFFCVFFFFLRFRSKGSREPWGAVWSRFSKPRGLTAVHTGPYFFPIERFLKLKEPQNGAVRGFSGRIVRSDPSLKTIHEVRFSSFWLYTRSIHLVIWLWWVNMQIE